MACYCPTLRVLVVHQSRELCELLRDGGLLGDAQVHAYWNAGDAQIAFQNAITTSTPYDLIVVDATLPAPDSTCAAANLGGIALGRRWGETLSGRYRARILLLASPRDSMSLELVARDGLLVTELATLPGSLSTILADPARVGHLRELFYLDETPQIKSKVPWAVTLDLCRIVLGVSNRCKRANLFAYHAQGYGALTLLARGDPLIGLLVVRVGTCEAIERWFEENRRMRRQVGVGSPVEEVVHSFCGQFAVAWMALADEFVALSTAIESFREKAADEKLSDALRSGLSSVNRAHSDLIPTPLQTGLVSWCEAIGDSFRCLQKIGVRAPSGAWTIAFGKWGLSCANLDGVRDELVAAAEGLVAEQVRVVSHGDLHAGNFLVSRRGEAMVIDCDPCLAGLEDDYATLEVSLLLDCEADDNPNSTQILETLRTDIDLVLGAGEAFSTESPWTQMVRASYYAGFRDVASRRALAWDQDLRWRAYRFAILAAFARRISYVVAIPTWSHIRAISAMSAVWESLLPSHRRIEVVPLSLVS